ncbi:leucine-rich repeat neuronal protein 3-like [Ornithodoros turicata]|uniref:leucine-rich repeat neuronal protein 3-like n=1 Tax=Ornithodoros turicata TaxID=34597 RepID=UPI003139FAE5
MNVVYAITDAMNALLKTTRMRQLIVLMFIALRTTADPTTQDVCASSTCQCVLNGNNSTVVSCVSKSLSQIPGPSSWLQDRNVIGVDFSHNNIVEITRLGPCSSLQSLDLHYNSIREVPPNIFSGLDNLDVLDLGHNNIAEIHTDAFEGLLKLTVLNLTGNFIETIHPDTLSKIPNLKHLSLCGNNLNAVDPLLFHHVRNLEHLDLRMSGLSSLPDNAFEQLSSLNTLELSENEFEVVPTAGLRSARGLKLLHFENNPVVTLTAESFEQVTAIEYLHLSAMPSLTTVEEGTFVGMKSLKFLDLGHNPQLSFIHPGAFYTDPADHSTPLETVYLGYNNLTSLGYPDFNWCSIPVLDLRGNPWNCDCSMTWVQTCRFHSELTVNLRCKEPADVSGLLISQLSVSHLKCPQRSPAVPITTDEEQDHFSLHVFAVMAGLLGLMMALTIALAAFKWRDIKYWIQNRKRVGAVYYVKARTNPSRPTDV